MKSLCLKLFGGFHACDAAEQEITIAGTKSALLLAYLALKPGKAYSREQLIGLFWGDRGDSQARGSLRQTLWLLGKGLKKIEPRPLIVQRESVAIDPATVQIDAITFESLVAEGSQMPCSLLWRFTEVSSLREFGYATPSSKTS